MIPCETCLKAPICKHKAYRHMLYECRDLARVLYKNGSINTNTRRDTFYEDLDKVYKHLNPTHWETGDAHPNCGPQARYFGPKPRSPG
jgi:hypothetical protein